MQSAKVQPKLIGTNHNVQRNTGKRHRALAAAEVVVRVASSNYQFTNFVYCNSAPLQLLYQRYTV